MKTRDSVPIILTKMVGRLHFVDSCPFLVFSQGSTCKGPQRHKSKGMGDEWGVVRTGPCGVREMAKERRLQPGVEGSVCEPCAMDGELVPK